MCALVNPIFSILSCCYWKFFAAEYKNGVKTRQQKPSGHFFIPPMSWLAGAFFKSANYPQLSPCFFYSSIFFKVEHVTLFHKKMLFVCFKGGRNISWIPSAPLQWFRNLDNSQKGYCWYNFLIIAHSFLDWDQQPHKPVFLFNL